MEEAVQARRLEIPVDGKHAAAVAGENPRHVGERHRAAGAALVGVEGDDLAAADFAHVILGSTTAFGAGRVAARRTISVLIVSSSRRIAATSSSSVRPSPVDSTTTTRPNESKGSTPEMNSWTKPLSESLLS